MYTIHVQFFDVDASGQDVVQPLHLETVGRLPSKAQALEYARMWGRHDAVAAVWIQADAELPS